MNSHIRQRKGCILIQNLILMLWILIQSIHDTVNIKKATPAQIFS